MPDYKIRRWTMTEIWRELEQDDQGCPEGEANRQYGRWLQEAFDSRKFAFVADWVRLYALDKYGGLYLDSDVEVFKSFDDLLELPYFLGFENGSSLETAVMGAQSGCRWVKACLAYYRQRPFVLSDISEMQKYIDRGEYISEPGLSVRPSPCIVAEMLSLGYRVRPIPNKSEFVPADNTVCVFPRRYFSFSDAANGSEAKDRYCLHHGVGAWKPRRVQRNLKIWGVLASIFGHKGAGMIITGAKRMLGKGRTHE